MTTSNQSESAVSPVQTAAVTAIPSVTDAHTIEELSQALMLMEKRAGDLVNSQVVREGYQAHGHPVSLGFQHLNTMTSSRIKKQFPLFDRTEHLFRILWAQGKLIVGEELVKKYESRKAGKEYDYTKAINRRFKKMFSDIEAYREKLRELKYEDSYGQG